MGQHEGNITLSPQEIEVVYTLSQAVAAAVNMEDALDQVIRIIRPVFIFDNIVLYEKQHESSLEPIYAKAVGRGRFREADLAWGEITANEAYQLDKTIIRKEVLEGAKSDRTNIRHLLGLPLRRADQVIGVLVFIRFGSPVFETDQIHLAELVSLHVALLLKYRQLVDQIANLEAQRRLDNLQDDFIAMITHELLTPLGFIKGYTTTLLREDASWNDETQREFLLIIDEESDRLRNLIDNLLDSSRLQAGTLHMVFQLIRLDVFLKELKMRVNSMYENLLLTVDVNTPGLQVNGDPTRLTQVFDNIIGNAVKYAPGSPVAISVEKIDTNIQISIQDQGPGIGAEHLEKIFQRFYRVPEYQTSARGSGLGLYICRKIIQAHEGSIHAESELGYGTTFYIFMPCDGSNMDPI